MLIIGTLLVSRVIMESVAHKIYIMAKDNKPTYAYNAFNVYRRELAPGTVSLTGDRAQGDDSKHWAYSMMVHAKNKRTVCTLRI